MNDPFLRVASTLLLPVAAVFGQTQTTARTFEVATIRLSAPLTHEMQSSGKAHVGKKIDRAYADFGWYSLRGLIAEAYRVRPYQLWGAELSHVGHPSSGIWTDSTHFDVLGKLPPGGSPDSVPEMLQALLADRFHLKLHSESREMQVYALVVGKGGPKLSLASDDHTWAPGESLMPYTLEDYAGILSGAVDRPVLDETGLNGKYMLPVFAATRAAMARDMGRFAPELATNGMEGLAATFAAEAQETSLTAALVGGLKLEPRKVQMPILVIDHVDATPTAD